MLWLILLPYNQRRWAVICLKHDNSMTGVAYLSYHSYTLRVLFMTENVVRHSIVEHLPQIAKLLCPTKCKSVVLQTNPMMFPVIFWQQRSNPEMTWLDSHNSDGNNHTWYLSFLLHWQNFWRIKFTPKNVNFCQFCANFCQLTPKFAPKTANFSR